MTIHEKYIEDVGLFYEKHGLPKMAGRILACLISSKNENNSFEYLRNTLKASNGSISGNINLLLHQNMVEKYMISGDRKSYYRIAIDSLKNIMDAKTQSITAFKQVIEQGLNITSKEDDLKYKSLSDILKYYEFLEREIPLLRMKWEEENKKEYYEKNG